MTSRANEVEPAWCNRQVEGLVKNAVRVGVTVVVEVVKVTNRVGLVGEAKVVRRS